MLFYFGLFNFKHKNYFLFYKTSKNATFEKNNFLLFNFKDVMEFLTLQFENRIVFFYSLE